MRREITLLILAVLLLGVIRVFAQQQIKPIKIGEKIPYAFLKEMVNYPTSSAKLSDFKGKALIIDIWATWCGGCLNAFPKMDSLQKKYKEQMNILLVTLQPKKEIEAFFAKKMWQRYKFPSVVNDTLLRKYFPHAGLPHQIWIDKSGIVRSINNGQYLKSEWLVKLFAGEKIAIREKSSVNDITITQGLDPLFIHDYESSKFENLISYGYVSRYQKDLQPGAPTEIDKKNGITRLSMRNMPWLMMLWKAVIGRDNFNNICHEPTMIIRNDTKPLALKGDLINYSNIFCYDGVLMDTSEASAREFMHLQLDAAFQTKSYAEIRKMKVYVLREFGNDHKYRNPASEIKSDDEAPNLIAYNNFLKYFIRGTNSNWKLKYPLVNEVPFDGKTYFMYDLSIDDPEIISKKLREYGLEIVEAERELKVLVVEDRI